MLAFVYRFLTDAGAPVISLYLRRRYNAGREDQERFAERFGEASLPRPPGRLLWCHAASVGEAASLLSLINKINQLSPATPILVTTGTVTSARMLAGRLPPHVMHHYMPVDRAPYVAKFLDHWNPDFVIWIESELWPNMLAAIRERLIPAVLINARMSDKSFRNWYRVKGWAKEILGTYSLCLTQTDDERTRFIALGAKPVRCVGNLKYAAASLPVDEKKLGELQAALAGRVVWLMASTHRGEEEMALETHKQLAAKWPNLLTIIVPRHAVRGNEIAEQISATELQFARRSRNESITEKTAIYLADTMGELGLFYRLAPVVVLGGSFAPLGGHNLIEAAQLGCAILIGPHMFNFTEIAREFTSHQAAIQLQNINELAFTIDRLLADPDTCKRLALAARTIAEQKQHVLDHILENLEPWLSLLSKKAA